MTYLFTTGCRWWQKGAIFVARAISMCSILWFERLNWWFRFCSTVIFNFCFCTWHEAQQINPSFYGVGWGSQLFGGDGTYRGLTRPRLKVHVWIAVGMVMKITRIKSALIAFCLSDWVKCNATLIYIWNYFFFVRNRRKSNSELMVIKKIWWRIYISCLNMN